MFADPDALDFDLLGGMPYLDLPQPPTGTSDRSRDQSSSQQRKSATSGDTTEGAVPAAGGRAAGEVEGDVPYEFDDQMFVVEDLPPEEEHPEQQESDQQQGRDQEDQGAPCWGRLCTWARACAGRQAGTLQNADVLLCTAQCVADVLMLLPAHGTPTSCHTVCMQQTKALTGTTSYAPAACRSEGW